MIQPLKLDPENSFVDEALGWTIAAAGAYFQVMTFYFQRGVFLMGPVRQGGLEQLHTLLRT